MASERMGTAETKRVTVAEAQRLAALLESATRLSEQTDGQDLLDPVLKVTHVGPPAPYSVDGTDVWAWSRTAVR